MSTPLQPKQWAHPKAGGKVRDVPISQVRTSQAYTNPDKVRSMVRRLQSGGKLNPIIASNAGGEIVTQDGHHRRQAYEEAGYKTIPVHIF